MKSQQKKKDTCQADMCNLRVFSPIFAEIIITSPSKMNTWGRGEGGGNQFSETLRYVKLFKLLQIDYFQQLIQSHL